MLHAAHHDPLSDTFNALADPTRRAMLARLASGEATVSDLAKPFLTQMTLPAITKHVQVLERAGLVTKTKDAQRRPCTLNAERLKVAADWIDQYRAFWEASFDRLDAYLKTVVQKNTPTAKGKRRANRSSTRPRRKAE
jgi:DNA-binding transcriptional ArsR family regulator